MVNQKKRNIPSPRNLSISSAVSTPFPTANAGSITSISTATISSTTRAPKTACVNFLFFMPRSSNALIIIDVDDMESIPPKKREALLRSPRIFPRINPTLNIISASKKTVVKPAPPTFFSLRKLNSRPSPKSRKTTPIFPQNSTLSILETVEKKVI